jgi:hypothetical protein
MVHWLIADSRYYHAVYDTSRSSIDSVVASIVALLPFLS